MFQSTVNLLGNTSTAWTSHYVKKIFRIPEDQLKILNNIPGWASDAASSQSNSPLTTVVDKENKQISSVALSVESTVSQKDLPSEATSNQSDLPLTTAVDKESKQISSVALSVESTISQKDLPSEATCSQPDSPLTTVVDKENKQISSVALSVESTVCQKDLIVDSKQTYELPEKTIRKRFPLRKSSSLDSVSVPETNSSHHIVKRSSSTSNIKEKATAVQNYSFDATNFSLSKAILTEKSLSKIEEVVEMQVDADNCSFEKPHYADSGVQCKMSQVTKLEASPSLSSNDSILKRESLKLLNAFTNQTNDGEKVVEKLYSPESKNCLDGKSVPFNESLLEKSKIDVDENDISQSVPCAQPPSENIHPRKELVTGQKESIPVLQNNYFTPTSKNVQSPLDNIPSKRKRKSKRESSSKKHKGVISEQIKIEYSPEQIKKMVELMKILEKY